VLRREWGLLGDKGSDDCLGTLNKILQTLANCIYSPYLLPPYVTASDRCCCMNPYFIHQLNQKQLSMKQFIAIICLAVVAASCNNAATTPSGSDSTGATTKPAAELNLPFKLTEPYKDWQKGSNENVIAAMGGLKAFVDKDMAALAAALGDSVALRFDYYREKLSRDSAMKVFIAQRAMYNDLVISMYDYESVISADKTEEYVTMWYKQSWKNDKGVADSVSVVDDCKMKGGKMIELDEKVQHYPAKK
jgi:hypothetical protein